MHARYAHANHNKFLKLYTTIGGWGKSARGWGGGGGGHVSLGPVHHSRQSLSEKHPKRG